ncbi:hypothetical protein JA1_001406 [Spathaspora sp. JA1]|nr:hypothetical protein JA1_001406 [Spathaspora sp. JA1]
MIQQHKLDIVFFQVNFTEFDNLIKLTLQEECSEEVIKYLHSCFVVYVIVNQQSWRSIGGRTDPFLVCFEKILPRCIVPLFFKDMIREMAKPMKTGNSIYIPDIESARANMSQELILEIINQQSRIETTFKKYNISQLEIEEIEPTCFTMYHEQQNLISIPRDNITVPPYRLKVISILKHMRFLQYRLVTSEESWVGLDRGNGNVAKMGNARDIFQNTNLTCGFCVFQHHGGVRVNSSNLMCVSVVELAGNSPLRNRFPTEPRFLRKSSVDNYRVQKRRKSRTKEKSMVPVLTDPGVLVNLKKSLKTA